MPDIGKIYSILELLREHSSHGLANKEISEKLGLPSPTSHRILSALKKYDLVMQRGNDSRYFLGYAHLRFAQALLESSDAASVADDYLETLHSKTGQTVFYAQHSGMYCVALEVHGPVNTRIAVGQGELLPVYCSGAGKAVLAFLPEEKRREIYNSNELRKYTDNTTVEPDKLEKELENIRSEMISFNKGEFHDGISAMACPVFNRRGDAIGSVTIVGTSVAVNDDFMNTYRHDLLQSAKEITQRLGGTFPE